MKIIHAVLFGVGMTTAVVFTPVYPSVRDMPENNFAYPVLVLVDGKSYASGFYIDDGNFFYFVTARHVFFDLNTKDGRFVSKGVSVVLTSYPINQKDEGRYVVKLDLRLLQSKGLVRSHGLFDVAVIRIAKCSKGAGGEDRGIVDLFDGALIVEQSKERSGLATARISNNRKYEDVLLGNEVFVFGYPSSIGLKEVPLIDYNRPLIKKGVVAGKNDANKTIILDCAVYPGNSGGPVIEIDRKDAFSTEYPVIGIVTDYIPFVEEWENRKLRYSNVQVSNSGYAVVAPIDAILEMIAHW